MTPKDPPSTEARRLRTVTWIVALATCGLIFDGYDLVVYGAVVSTFLRDPTHIGNVTPAIAGLLGSYALVGVMVGALLATRVRPTRDMRLLLAGCYLVQALGIAIGVWSPSLAGFAIGSVLLGLPFTAITFFAMQEVRRLRPGTAASTMGLLTAMYGLGQIVGPPLAALLLRTTGDLRAGFTLSLQIAAAALLLGAAIYAWMRRTFAQV